MSGDPNWFLSTVAQSTAALVAIIGGLLISRLVSLAADRDGLIRTRQRLNVELISATTHADKLRAQRLNDGWSTFLEFATPQLVDSRGIISTDDLLDEVSLRGFDDEEWRADASESIERTLAAYAGDVSGARDVGWEPLYQAIESRLAKERADAERSAREAARSPVDKLIAQAFSRGPMLPTMSGVINVSRPVDQTRYQTLDRRFEQQMDADAAVRSLQARIADLDREISDIGRPRGIWVSAAMRSCP